MAAFTIAGLTYLGGSILSWGLSKGYDKAFSISNTTLKDRLTGKNLPQNNDIERAVLTAHYKALQFIVEQTFSQDNETPLNNQSLPLKHIRGADGFKRIFKSIDKEDFTGLISDRRGDWQAVIPINFEESKDLASVHQALPPNYVQQATADLLSLANWSPTEKKALSEWAGRSDLGWAVSFTAYLSQDIKTNDDFYKVFSVTNQQHQIAALASIEETLKTQLAPNNALAEAMSRVEESLKRIEDRVDEANERLERIEEKIDQSVKRQHYENEAGHQYPNYLAKLLIKSDIDEGLWEDEITTALTRYVAGKTQLEKQTNLPHHLEAKRAEALAFYEQAKLDEGEAILQELVEHITQEEFETAARHRAMLITDQVPFALAKLDYNRALDLYEQASNTVLAIDKRQAIEWLNKGASLGYQRGLLFGEGFINRARALYLKSRSLMTLGDGSPELGFETVWAMTQNNLGGVYQIKGQRGEDGALDKAITAYKATLTINTKDAAPMDWAAAQNNLANVYRIKGERGEDGALDKAIDAYKDALTIYTKDAAPMDWAMTQNNLGGVYRIKGERGEDGALDKAITAYKDTLTIRTKDAAPMDWAAAQNSLAIVYQIKGQRGADGALDKAIAAYKAALTFRTKDAAPMQWAMTQNNLANVYRIKGERGEDGALDKAIAACKGALTIQTKDAAPMDWAMTMANLALTYFAKGEGKLSEIHFRDALLEFKKNDVPAYINKLENMMRKCGFKP